MSREIKFRAWDKTIKQMLFGSTSMVIRFSGQVTDGSSTPDVALMQYTGLKDKNGVDIYEGDFLLIPDSETEPILDDGSGPTYDINHVLPVEFADGSFGVRVENGGNDFKPGWNPFGVVIRYNGMEPHEFEVVGNVYENPELLSK